MSKDRDEIQRLIDENKPLMDTCSKVAHDLFVAERAKAIWIWVGENSTKINDAGFGKPFGIWQEMALTQMFVSVGRAFDEERWGAPYCIQRVLREMRSAHLIDRKRFTDYLEPKPSLMRALARLTDEQLVARGFEIISRRRPTANGSAQLRRILEIRHTEVAHNSDEESGGDGRATFEDVADVLEWGKDFIGMMGAAFGSHVFKFDDGTYWSDFDVKSAVVSLRRLTHKASIVIDPTYAERERMIAELEAASNVNPAERILNALRRLICPRQRGS